MTDRQVLGDNVRVTFRVGFEAELVGQSEVVIHDKACDLYWKLVSKILFDPGSPKNGFGGVRHDHAAGPWMNFRVAPSRVTGHHKWLRNALGVNRVVNSERVRGSKGDNHEHIFGLNELIDKFNGLSCDISIVFDDEFDIAPGNATVFIHVLVVGVPSVGDVAIGCEVA